MGIAGKKDPAMDSLAAGIAAQAERGNSDTMCGRAQYGVTRMKHIPNCFGTSSNTDTKQQQTSGAEAGVAVRMMRLLGGARSSQRGGSITGRPRESIFSGKSAAGCSAALSVPVEERCLLSGEPETISRGSFPALCTGHGEMRDPWL